MRKSNLILGLCIALSMCGIILFTQCGKKTTIYDKTAVDASAITFDNQALEWTGSAITLPHATNVPDRVGVIYSIKNNAGDMVTDAINPGTYTITATFSLYNTNAFQWKGGGTDPFTKTATLTITKKTLVDLSTVVFENKTISVIPPNTTPYSLTAPTNLPTTGVLSGFPISTGPIGTATQTAAGSYPATVTIKVDSANYMLTGTPATGTSVWISQTGGTAIFSATLVITAKTLVDLSAVALSALPTSIANNNGVPVIGGTVWTNTINTDKAVNVTFTGVPSNVSASAVVSGNPLVAFTGNIVSVTYSLPTPVADYAWKLGANGADNGNTATLSFPITLTPDNNATRQLSANYTTTTGTLTTKTITVNGTNYTVLDNVSLRRDVIPALVRSCGPGNGDGNSPKQTATNNCHNTRTAAIWWYGLDSNFGLVQRNGMLTYRNNQDTISQMLKRIIYGSSGSKNLVQKVLPSPLTPDQLSALTGSGSWYGDNAPAVASSINGNNRKVGIPYDSASGAGGGIYIYQSTTSTARGTFAVGNMRTGSDAPKVWTPLYPSNITDTCGDPILHPYKRITDYAGGPDYTVDAIIIQWVMGGCKP